MIMSTESDLPKRTQYKGRLSDGCLFAAVAQVPFASVNQTSDFDLSSLDGMEQFIPRQVGKDRAAFKTTRNH